MEKIIIKADGMSCEHCVKAVKNAVGSLSGSPAAEVDLKAGTVSVEYDPVLVTADEIKTAIEEQGYDIVDSD